MALEIKIPSVGESVSEVTIAAWLKKSGDYVEMDDPIAELETDKATVELNAPEDGVLKILIEEGEDVEVEMVVAELDTKAEKPASLETKPTEEKPKEEERETLQNAGNNYATGTPSPAASKILSEKKGQV